MALTWFYEHPYCTDSHLLLFLFLLTNVLIVSHIKKRLKALNALNVNVNVSPVRLQVIHVRCYTHFLIRVLNCVAKGSWWTRGITMSGIL